MDFTEDEKQVLTLLFKIFNQILNFGYGYIDGENCCFNREMIYFVWQIS